jgi:hypothetical protein
MTNKHKCTICYEEADTSFVPLPTFILEAASFAPSMAAFFQAQREKEQRHRGEGETCQRILENSVVVGSNDTRCKCRHFQDIVTIHRHDRILTYYVLKNSIQIIL